MNLENTKTEKCLMRALQGEAVAHLKYQFYKSMLNNFTTEYNDELDEIIHNEKRTWKNLVQTIERRKYTIKHG